jgi:hypothetical protein
VTGLAVISLAGGAPLSALGLSLLVLSATWPEVVAESVTPAGQVCCSPNPSPRPADERGTCWGGVRDGEEHQGPVVHRADGDPQEPGGGGSASRAASKAASPVSAKVV